MKRLNASIPDDVHKGLRIALAEDETNFADWVRERIGEYLAAKESKGKGKPGKGARGMEEDADKVLQLLHADMKVDRQIERQADVETLTEIIHYYREKRARSSEIALAIVKFVKEG